MLVDSNLLHRFGFFIGRRMDFDIQCLFPMNLILFDKIVPNGIVPKLQKGVA